MCTVPLYSLGLQPRRGQVVKGVCRPKGCPAFGRGPAHLGASR